jgi:arabinofuranan 3-O-arabinosyltransferase
MIAHSPQPRSTAPPLHLPRSVELIAFALCVAHAVYLASSYVLGHWLYDPNGYSEGDFVNVWAAGQLALHGAPASAYDFVTHKQVQVAAVGHDFAGGFAWYYPPTYLFVAVLVASFPYVPAWVGWVFLTFPAYLATIRIIVGDRLGIFLACAFPAILSNFLVGQNGFLTAGLLGGTLASMERRPWLAGCFLGLLTYKPHFGLLFPVVLVAAGQWRVIIAAAVVTAMLATASWLSFGSDTWEAFFRALAAGSQSIFGQGSVAWGKLQTMYGLVRLLGGGEAVAWSVQGFVIALCAILNCILWRSRIPFALKAAALATGALLSTPYLFLYDLVAVAVPMVFLLRAGIATQIATYEWIGLGIASLSILLYPAFEAPVGIPALLIVAGLIGRRVIDDIAANARATNDLAAPAAI